MMRSLPVDGFCLGYLRSGTGDPVLLLNGWPSDHGDWDEVIRRHGGTAQMIAPDLRGFGESDRHQFDPSVAYSAAA